MKQPSKSTAFWFCPQIHRNLLGLQSWQATLQLLHGGEPDRSRSCLSQNNCMDGQKAVVRVESNLLLVSGYLCQLSMCLQKGLQMQPYVNV